MISDQTNEISKLPSVAMYGGSGTAAFAGLLPGDWQAVGVICGIALGVVGYITSLYFKVKHYELAKRNAGIQEAE